MIAFRAGLAMLILAAIGEAQPAELPPAPGRLIDIGGRRLHVLCSGQGAPTVILEAGASSFAIDWTLVHQDVSRTVRTCSYDRAGMGWSDPVPEGTQSSSASDLHGLLQKAGETGPFVLVGASRGGLLVRAYAQDHPEDGLSSSSRHSIVAGAGHEIHLFDPTAVVVAITDVVRAIREKSALPSRN